MDSGDWREKSVPVRKEQTWKLIDYAGEDIFICKLGQP